VTPELNKYKGNGMQKTTELSEAKRALLAKYIRGEVKQATKSVEPIPRRVDRDTAPLSFGQQQMWLLAQLIGDIPVYTECVTIHLPGPLDGAILERSFNEILKRHEAWRTSFPVIDGQPVQKIHPQLTISLPVVDLRHLPETEREAEAIRMMEEDAKQPFDLVNGPLLHPTLVRLGDEDHRLFLTLHHIIFDGHSLYQVFLPELRTLYEAFLMGHCSPLAELSIQYADFALWQRNSLQGEVLEEQLAYWKKQLAGVPEGIALPTDRPRPSVPTYRGEMLPFALSRQLTDALKALGRREEVTLYMVLVASFQTMLYRYTGQDDILLGMVISDRKRPELQKLMGFFLNTLVLRSNLSGNPTFRDLLQRVREATLEAQAYPDVPFERLVKELQPERTVGQNPLFQVTITIEPPLTLLPSGWTLTQMDVPTHTAKFDLSLELDDRPEGLIGRFEYNSDLFDAATITRLVGHWQTLLKSIVVDSTQHIAELPLLTAAEQQQLLVEWNATATDYPKDKGIHQLFEEQVERTPDSIALVFGEQQMTYRELNVRANQLAHYLRRLGVAPDVLVGIYMDRSFELAVSVLGILKAGGAYVPLDPTYPEERLAFMLADAQISVLLTQGQQLVDGLPRHQARVLCVDSDWQIIAQENKTNLDGKVKGENLAYVIYTSGSMGKPKGVMISHHAICNHMFWSQSCLPLSETDRIHQKTPFSFDASVWEFFAPLLAGAQLIIAQPGRHQDSEYLVETIIHHGVTTIKLVPSLLRVLLEHRNIEQCTSLRRVLCGAEEMPIDLQRLFYTRLAADLYNLYGPTEATIDATYWSCQSASTGQRVPIGHPIANTQVYILNAHLHLVPVNVPGDLYIGGDSLARGYLNRPELTAERFIRDPFSDEPGKRLYKTGDLARYRSDGAIEFLGRLDHQVKLRGFRIELGEIEAVLGLYPAVRQAVVVAREDVPGDKRLVAYVVLHEKQAITLSDLQDHVAKQLPSYMVPTAFVLLEALPLMTNGKVDRQALPIPDQVRPGLQEAFVAPRTEIEEAVARFWSQVLRIERIGIYDNFFVLGGHSLLATQVLSRLRATLQVDVSLRRFFEAPTVAELSRIIEQQKASGTERQKSGGPTIRAVSREAHRVKLSSIPTTQDSSSSRK